MSEIAKYVQEHASRISPKVVRHTLQRLPMLKAEFTQIKAPKFPHLVDQLELLADAVEDFAEGAYDDFPYYAIAEATFAIIYAHQGVDIIPDFDENFGYADDSAVVRTVLIKYEKDFARYAKKQGFNWKKITNKP